MTEVLVYNESEDTMILPQRTHLGYVVEYEADGCYPAHSDTTLLATKPEKAGNWARRSLYSLLTTIAAFHIATGGLPTVNHSGQSSLSVKYTLLNGITIYKDSEAASHITDVTKCYSQL